jgi:hypothetical protein
MEKAFKVQTKQLQNKLDIYIDLHEKTYIKWSDDQQSSFIEMSGYYYDYVRTSDLEIESYNLICRFADFFHSRRRYCEKFTSCCLIHNTISLLVHNCHKYGNYTRVTSDAVQKTIFLPVYAKYCDDIAKVTKRNCKQFITHFHYVLFGVSFD